MSSIACSASAKRQHREDHELVGRVVAAHVELRIGLRVAELLCLSHREFIVREAVLQGGQPPQHIIPSPPRNRFDQVIVLARTAKERNSECREKGERQQSQTKPVEIIQRVTVHSTHKKDGRGGQKQYPSGSIEFDEHEERKSKTPA